MTALAAAWTYRAEPELMRRLKIAQGHPANCHQDIVTIVGFFTSHAELARHVARYEQRVAQAEAGQVAAEREHP